MQTWFLSVPFLCGPSDTAQWRPLVSVRMIEICQAKLRVSIDDVRRLWLDYLSWGNDEISHLGRPRSATAPSGSKRKSVPLASSRTVRISEDLAVAGCPEPVTRSMSSSVLVT